MIEDQITFNGKYKDWAFSAHFNLNKKSEEEAAAALLYIHQHIEEKAFCMAGVNCSKIKEALNSIDSLDDLIRFYGEGKPKEINELLLGAVEKEELLPIAESYLICESLKRSGMMEGMKALIEKFKKNAKKEEANEGIVFIGKYKDWVAIKKMTVDKSTKDYEVAGMLANINTTLINKAFFFLNPKPLVDVSSLCKGKRKSYKNAADVLKKIKDKLRKDIESAYVVKEVFEKLNFAPYANLTTFSLAYPDLKMPKIKGRKPKG